MRARHSWLLTILPALIRTVLGCSSSDASSCPVDQSLGLTAQFPFSSLDSEVWSTDVGNGTTASSDSAGVTLTVDQAGDGPAVNSVFYIYGGRLEVWAKGALGTGIWSYIGLVSDTSQQILWGFDGDGGYVVAEYYSAPLVRASNTTISVDNSNTEFHNYTLVWGDSQTEWFVDGQSVSSMTAAALGSAYPWYPMYVTIFMTVGPFPEPDFSEGPFEMSVLNATVTDGHTGVQTWTLSASGDTLSVDTTQGTSTVAQKVIDDGDAVVSSTSSAATTKSTSVLTSKGSSASGSSTGPTASSTSTNTASTISSSNTSTPSNESSSNTSSTSSSTESSGGLSTAAKAGIGAGVAIAGLALIFAMICFCFRRKKRDQGQLRDGEAGARLVNGGEKFPHFGLITVQQQDQPGNTGSYTVHQAKDGTLVLKRYYDPLEIVPSFPNSSAASRASNGIFMLQQQHDGTQTLQMSPSSPMGMSPSSYELSGKPVYVVDNRSELPG